MVWVILVTRWRAEGVARLSATVLRLKLSGMGLLPGLWRRTESCAVWTAWWPPKLQVEGSKHSKPVFVYRVVDVISHSRETYTRKRAASVGSAVISKEKECIR